MGSIVLRTGNPRLTSQWIRGHLMDGELIVISGASGFIGRRLAVLTRRLRRDVEILCLSGPAISAYDRRGLDCLDRADLRPTEADFVTGKGLKPLQQQPRLVFHLAANTATGEKDHSCNDLGTRNFIESLAELGPGSHVIFTSSIAVTDDRRDYSCPIVEGTENRNQPLTEYGRSKLRAELWLKERARAAGFALTILRLVTVYGPCSRSNTMIPVLERHIKLKSPLVRLNWPGLTGLVHVNDVVSVILSLASMPPADGTSRTLIVQGETRTFADLCQIAHQRLGKPYRGIRLPSWFWHQFFRSLSASLRCDWPLPPSWRGTLWRLRLLAGNVFWTENDKLKEVLPWWIPHTFNDTIGTILCGAHDILNETPDCICGE
jgi:polyketide synthase